MIKQYQDVVIKPNRGKSGYHILHVSLIDEDEELYEIHHESAKKLIKGKNRIYSFVKKFCRNQTFIVQQRIPLASIYGCPFDIRVMVQRLTRSSKWCITGKLARIAEKDFFVTNVSQKPALIKDIIPRSSAKNCPLKKLSLKLQKVVLAAAISFESVYPDCRIIGFDVGLQENGDIRIIEANFSPMLSLFKYLDDKSMYKTIIRYKYGKV
ncbi:YheC/YheD family protein [Paenibacillus agaridevorans]|uniref:YheC/YheD family protein n=1 Tax=Paenibacillus agaridevorans TaxID=171404 RepID=UPI001BE4B496|nr:YheC/YheD family protein [Paenibacillus agaridevorans]